MTLVQNAPDLFGFVSAENENFLNTLASFEDEKHILTTVQSLYSEVIKPRELNENDVVLFQLLLLTHYHFLFSLSCFMRGHLSEAFASVRVATDAALIASVIITDRSAQVAYLKREKPFDKLNRHLKNLVANGTDLHHAVAQLLKLHDLCSTFASHADVNSFVHRFGFTRDGQKRGLQLQYFQFSPNEAERRVHVLNIFYCFVLILDLFADYLVDEQKTVPAEWRTRVVKLGQYVVQKNAELQPAARAKYE